MKRPTPGWADQEKQEKQEMEMTRRSRTSKPNEKVFAAWVTQDELDLLESGRKQRTKRGVAWAVKDIKSGQWRAAPLYYPSRAGFTSNRAGRQLFSDYRAAEAHCDPERHLVVRVTFFVLHPVGDAH